MSHSLRQRREEVDSRLLVVGSQIVSLILGPSFAHNLGCRCPNGQCKAIWTSTLQDLFNDLKNASRQGDLTPQIVFSFWESRRTPSLHFLGVGVAFSHLAQSGVVTHTLCGKRSFPHPLVQFEFGNTRNVGQSY